MFCKFLISSPGPTLVLANTKKATSDQVGFSVLNSRTSGYTAQNQRGERFGQTSTGFVAFRREIRVGKIVETRRPRQKEIVGNSKASEPISTHKYPTCTLGKTSYQR